MTKHPWTKSMSNHIDPEKEEQLRWMKIGKQTDESLESCKWRICDSALKPKRMAFKACLPPQCYPERGYLWYTEWQLIRKIDTQVKRIIKLTKNINHGNKERNLRSKSEVIHLIEDFQKQYDSLYSLYEDLREEVKKNVGGRDDDSPLSSSSDSETFYSPGGSNTTRTNQKSNSTSKGSDSDIQEPETSDLEDTILKDKLTSSSEVKKILNLDSSSEVILKDLRVQSEESEHINRILDQKNDLEAQVENLKLDISTLCMAKTQLEEQVERKSDESKQMKDKITRLEAQVSEIEAKSKENERRLLGKQSNQNTEQNYLSRISELVAQTNDMQLELDTLKNQKGELEGRFINETEKSSSQVKGLMKQVNSLKNELANVNSQKDKLKLQLDKKSKETSECLIQIEGLKSELASKDQSLAEENEGLKAHVNDLESKIRSTKSDLEEQVKKINNDAIQSNVENETLQRKISELQTSLSEKENELTTEQKKFTETLENEKTHFQEEIQALQDEKTRLQTELDKEKVAFSPHKYSQPEKISKSSFQLVEKKVEDMADEFRKQLEDKYRILSRRIRVAEQLQVENKEWYRKTKETYEQQNKDLKCKADRNEIEFKYMKDMTITANDVLSSLDSVALKFEECSANFLNRISKASCELKFAKHWAMRKNKAVLHVKDDLDCLLAQLDDKEAEILVFREKVWKSENKARELEKMVKEKEDAMLGLKEEKREAIRQLCVWIDHHRGRSDYYMKMLSEMNPGRKRSS